MPSGIKGSVTAGACSVCGVDCLIRATGMCKKCYARNERIAYPERVREREQRRYWRNRTKLLAKAKLWRTANKTKAYEISRKQLARVEAIKTAAPCLDCGRSFPAECIDFDHRPGTNKVKSVGHMIACRWSWEKIEAEIAKCDIVCANCHRIRTKARLTEKRKAA